jgi:inward rectifier potassium channel
MSSLRKTIRYTNRAPNFRVRIHGQAFELGGDAYFALLTRPWWQFFIAVGVYVLSINALFAGLYLMDPGGVSNSRIGSFEDAFFFSVQTLATIGYGTMAPETTYAHVIVTIESILGVLAVGSFAGVAFARLSRPTARVLFSDKLVIRPRNGIPHLQFRMANWRTNMIVEATLLVYFMETQRTREGDTMRVPVEIKLVRSSSPFFFLSWTAMHLIDETSPFFGDDAIERLTKSGTLIYVSLTGYDQTLGQTVHAYSEYSPKDIVQNAKFRDFVTVTADGTRELDFSLFHEIEALPPKM